MESRSKVADFVTAFKSRHSSMRVFAWIEIWTHLDNADGYRLDDSSLHSNIADFCRLLVTQLGFDGLLLDVKPLFSDNSDLIRLIQQVRAAVGVDVPLAVAVTADLTPPDGRLKALESIAPGTMWSASFKRRLLVSVDEVVLLMYQSIGRTRATTSIGLPTTLRPILRKLNHQPKCWSAFPITRRQLGAQSGRSKRWPTP